jgi:phosphoribosyl 1,2-cyclic phosphodiesterase
MHPEITTPQCVLDRSSVTMPPDQNPNYRNNPSILIRHVTQRKPDSSNSSSSDVKYVQIDACKTFREGVLRWYPRHGVTSLDGIVLTHDHADAILGLDDVSVALHKPWYCAFVHHAVICISRRCSMQSNASVLS